MEFFDPGRPNPDFCKKFGFLKTLSLKLPRLSTFLLRGHSSEKDFSGLVSQIGYLF